MKRDHLSYRWHPEGATPVYTFGLDALKVGALVPLDHRVFRVVEINPRDPVDWSDEDRRVVKGIKPELRDKYAPRMMVLRPIDAEGRDNDEHYQIGGRSRFTWHVYPDEHYPICSKCHEPVPCREQMAERISEAAGKLMGRYDLAGKCPACDEVVTRRQESVTFPDNVVVMFGPPVTFHRRRRCFRSAVAYEKRWAAADPENRQCQLSCTGNLTNHNDGTYECTTGASCPGVVEHRAWSVCDCHGCHARGRFGCHPPAGAVNRAHHATLDAARGAS